MIGVGRFGQNHSRILAGADFCEYAGLYDIDQQRAAEISARDGVKNYSSQEDLFDDVEAVVIAVSTANHYQVCKDALEKGKHVLVEKPVTTSPEEARELIESAARADLHFFTGHLERFNPAIRRAMEIIPRPLLIRAERHGTWSPRQLSADVIIDLMIHDIDITLQYGFGELTVVSAHAQPIVSSYYDLCDCCLKSRQGTTIQLYANRASSHRRRTLELHGESEHVFVDMINQTVSLVAADEEAVEKNIPVTTKKPLDEELRAFCSTIRGDHVPILATGNDGMMAVSIANAIKALLQ